MIPKWFGVFSFLFFLLLVPAHTEAKSQLPKEITFSELPIQLQFIALCESGGRHEVNDKVIQSRTDDWGIMQISRKYHLKRSINLGYDIFSPQGNMAYALFLYTENGLNPWRASMKCYRKLSYLSLATLPL